MWCYTALVVVTMVVVVVVVGLLHEGEVRAVGYLRGDAGAPAHGLLATTAAAVAPRRGPTQGLGAVTRPYPRPSGPRRVTPRLPPGAPAAALMVVVVVRRGGVRGVRWAPSALTGGVVVVVVVAAVLTGDAPAAARTPGGALGAVGVVWWWRRPHAVRRSAPRVLALLLGGPAGGGPREAVAEGLGGDVGQHHVAEAQPHALRVEGLDLARLALQQRADALQTLVLEGGHLLLDLETNTQHRNVTETMLLKRLK